MLQQALKGTETTDCPGSSSTSLPSSVTTSTAGSTTPTTTPPAGPFISTIYGYAVRSPNWTGTMATTAWDGTSALGDGDPAVDLLVNPNGHRVFVYGGPTKAKLKNFVTGSRATDAKAHPCPKTPQATGPTTIDDEPAIFDESTAPQEPECSRLPRSLIHVGHVYVFGTYDQPGKEAEMSAWFGAFLENISFEV